MGSSKTSFFEDRQAEVFTPLVCGPAPVRSYTERQHLLERITEHLAVLRSEITEIPGALSKIDGDYSPACFAAINRIDAIELKIKRL